MMWSRHSRRMVRMTRSTYARCHGERGADKTCLIPCTLSSRVSSVFNSVAELTTHQEYCLIPCVSKRLPWSCALTVWSVMESLVGSLRLSKSASTGATFVTAVEKHGGEQTLIDDFDFYVGIDLAFEKHQACVVNRTGKVVGELAFENSGAGLIDFINELEKLSGSLTTRVGIVLETRRASVVECVLERILSFFD